MTDFYKVQAFLFSEARALDDRQWDQWLQHYHTDAVFWMPAWDDNDKLTTDPQSEMSLIYYPNRSGIEDRVFRIKTERSSASTPEPRTTHLISNIELLSDDGKEIKLRFNWVTHNFRYKVMDVFFGTSHYILIAHEGSFLITSKKVILNNDYIRQVIDVYHI